jgi:hypothetical protein
VLPSDELRHLQTGPTSGEQHHGVDLVEVTASAKGDAYKVLDRARAVLSLVLIHGDGRRPELSEWMEILPRWFVDACAPEQSLEDEEQWITWWRNLPHEEQRNASREKRWTLSGWLLWFEPSERPWYWWDGIAEDSNRLRVFVEIIDWPGVFGALEWLLRASGAINIVRHET